MSTVPIQYDPDAVKRSLAIAPRIVAPAQLGAPPPSISPGYQGTMPNLAVTLPQLQPPPGAAAARDESEVGRLLSTGSGISQIPARIENSRFGQRHPLLGKILGYGAEGAAGLGDLGLTTLGGGIGQLAAMEIPGTPQHHQMLLNRAERQETEDVGNEEREAQAENLEADVPLKAAQTENLEHPPAQVLQSPEGDVLVNPRGNGEAIPITEAGRPVTPMPKAASHIVLQGPHGQPMLGFIDPVSRTVTDQAGNTISNPVLYEKPPNEGPHPGISHGRPVWGVYTPGKGWTDAETGQPLPDFQWPPTFAQTGLWQPTEGYDSQGNLVPGKFNERTGEFIPFSGGPAPVPKDVMGELGKELQTAREADKRLRIMEQNEAAAMHGDQQAMLSLVANHIGMTLGAQKGARINQAVWNEAIKSAPFLQNVAKKWGPDGYLQGVTLSPDQVRQMVALGQVVRDTQWKQVDDAFANYGVLTTPEGQERRRGEPAGFKVDPAWPDASKHDGKYLLDASGKAVAKSVGGKWVQP